MKKRSRSEGAADESRQVPFTNPTTRYVYILESEAVPGHFYIGSTENLRQRLRQQQADVDAHAADYRLWKIKTAFARSFHAGLQRGGPRFRLPRWRIPLRSGRGRAGSPSRPVPRWQPGLDGQLGDPPLPMRQSATRRPSVDATANSWRLRGRLI